MRKPVALKPLTKDQKNRFWAKVNRVGPHQCWLWTASYGHNGYGQFKVGSRMVAAHRVAFFLGHGGNAKNNVCHRCDRKLCCNPKHLFDGTAKENSQDAKRKGRTRGPYLKGERNPRAKLSVKQILTIRKSTKKQTQLGRDYGVTQSAIWRIKNRLAWRHVA